MMDAGRKLLGQESQFFLKDGYRQQTERHTFETAPGDYWTPYRIGLSQHFQYYVYLHAQALLKSRSLSSVLDVGSGPGTKAEQLLADHCESVTLMDQPTVEQVASRVAPRCRFLPVDLEDPERSTGEKYDVVICADVLEHLIDPNPALDFIRDHLSDRGVAILSTPERDFLRGFDCAESPKPEHVREWNRDEFAAWVSSRGLSIEEHVMMPQRKLNPVAYWLSKRQVDNGIFTARGASCQMIVARAGG